MKKILLACLCLFGAGMSMVTMAAGDSALIAQNLKKVDPRIQVRSVNDTPVSGVYEVVLKSGEVLYSDGKGEYFMLGKMYQLSDTEGFVNLTEKTESTLRLEQLASVSEKDMVVYPPAGEVKATINIFTDVDCPYCRKLHAEVPKLNEMGVQVNYLAFPRNGEGTATFRDMVSIWCTEGDAARRQAMDAVKQGKGLAEKSCDNPVMQQFALGQSIGVSGTPAIVLEDGRLLPGYVKAAQLGKLLEIK